MKTILSLFALSFLISNLTFSQAPLIQWENTIGSGDDELRAVIQTANGGYALAGWSGGGIYADKTEVSYAQDYWVVLTDQNGNITAQNTLHGNDGDYLTNIQQTTDGGFILGGYTESGNWGDKSENHLCGCLGDYDVWVVKLDADLNIVWNNTLGGSNYDFIYTGCLQQTYDGGYMVGITSSSGDHDITETGGGGGYQYCLIKLNSAGNVVWENTILGGGILHAARQTADGGFILGGYSGTNAFAEKTVSSFGDDDYWVVKTDSVGNIQWQKDYGGNKQDELFDITQTSDGGYILGGHTFSGISGNKTETVFGGVDHFEDWWVIKTDNIGNIQWQKDLGGNKTDVLYSVKEAPGGEFILGGYAESGITGNKTEAGLGGRDYWVVKLNSTGAIVWQNTLGGSLDDYLYEVTVTSDGGYILAGQSKSNASADKSEASISAGPNYWVVKLYPDNCIPAAEICNLIDDNCNGIVDDGIIETCNISAAGPTSFCPGGSVVLNATYSGTSVQWKKDGLNISGATLSSYTATAKGTYTCQTTSVCGSATSVGITINIYKNPSAFVSPSGPTLFCAGGSVTLTETPSGGCSYQWYNGASLLPGATTNIYVATTTGNYKCRVTKVVTGCYKNSNVVAVSVPCREDGTIELSEFNIYPNPASDYLTITTSGNNNISQFNITDITGKIIQQFEMQDQFTIEISNYPAGIYFIKMDDGIDSTIQKFVKQ